jgi:carbon monoxide dehydrogenase subunit G
MKLEHEFTVPAPVEDAWRVLLDVERVAPCMPGAALTSVDGDDFTGTVKVKVGPIQVTYKGQARFAVKDDAAHRAVLEASGKEARGSGTAAATVSAVLEADGPSRTKVKVETDLNITGRPAQFGRGVMADVGAKLIGQFADCLADELGGGAGASGASGGSEGSTVAAATAQSAAAARSDGGKAQPVETAATAPLPPTTSATPEAAPAPATPLPPPRQPSAPRREAEPIDLLEVAGASVAKRVAPVAAALVAVLLLLLIRRRKH